MANQAKLSATLRKESGTNEVKQVRDRGGIPAVIYSSKIQPQNLELNRREVELLLAHAAGESILVDLEIADGNSITNTMTLIQEVQHHPVRGDVLHVDFHAVSATETIEAEIPIEPVGEADGVKNYGGILESIVRSLPIRCLPQDLPEILKVDVTNLKVGDTLHVGDLVLPKGVEAAMDPGVTVLSIAAPNVAVEAADTSAAPTEPEVLSEKKPAENESGASEEK